MTTMTPEEGLRIGLANLFKTEEYSDLTVKCGPYEFKVHKAVICQQSEYFKAACRSNSFREGDTKLIILDTSDKDDPACDDPEAVNSMIQFFYHLDYELREAEYADICEPFDLGVPELTGADTGKSSDLEVAPVGTNFSGNVPAYKSKKARLMEKKNSNAFDKLRGVSDPVETSAVSPHDGDALAQARVFAVAVKYHVLPLRALATRKFQSALKAYDENRATFPNFAKTITTVYSTTPEDVLELRNIVTDTLTKNKALLSQEDIKAAVCGLPGLSFDLLRKVLDRVDSQPKTCPHCRSSVKQEKETNCIYCGGRIH